MRLKKPQWDGLALSLFLFLFGMKAGRNSKNVFLWGNEAFGLLNLRVNVGVQRPPLIPKIKEAGDSNDTYQTGDDCSLGRL